MEDLFVLVVIGKFFFSLINVIWYIVYFILKYLYKNYSCVII